MEFFDRFHLSRLVVFSALVSMMSAFSSNAQVIGIDDGDQVVCGDLFEDDGDVFGPDGGPYSNNNYVITLCPDQPGSAVSVEFVLFDLQTNANPNNNDVLYIYDGDDTNAPLVGAGTGNSYEGVTISGSLNNPTGCLTFFFAVNNGASGGNLGWSANLTCVTPCTTPTSSLVLTSPSAFPGNPESVGICPVVDAVSFDGSGSTPDGAPLENWIWNWGDGSVETTTAQTASHSYDVPGEYIVTLTVEDENGCSSTNLEPFQVLVSTLPEFNTSVESPVCVGSVSVLDGSGFQSVLWTALPPQSVSENIVLPDNSGFPFESEMEIDFFDSGQEVTECSDILSITANMNHTFIGDLTIWIECPNGQEMLLLENGPSGSADPGGCMYPDLGGTDLGEPANLPDTGVGYDYTWDENNGVYIMDDPTNPDITNVVPAGVYLPCGSTCDLVGCPLNGVWTFLVHDQWGGDDGYLFNWNLEFDPTIVPGVTTFEPTIGIGVDSSYWDIDSSSPEVQSIDDVADVVEFIFDAPGSYDYTYNVVNSFGCAWDTTITIDVITGPSSNITAGPDQVFCGTPVVLEGEFITTTPSACAASQGTETVCYGNGANDIYTYCPDNPGDGTMMSIEFYDGQIEACVFDQINVFDGSDVTAPLVETLCGLYTGTNVMATNPDGCLTVQITSDGSVSCASGSYDPVSWCVGCGMEDACGFTWTWDPPLYLDDPNAVQPTVLDFDGAPFEYTLSVEPIGFENCAATDVVMVVPGFEYTTSYSDPTCLITDGEIVLNISEPAAEGPWDVQLSDLTGVLDQQSFGGGILVFDNLEAGNYSLEVSDQNGCTYTSDFDLADPLPPAITVSPDEVICIGGAATLTASAASGGPYVFNWSVNGAPVGQGASLLVGPDATTVYDVQGVDAAGCITQSGSVQVGIYDAFTVGIDAVDLICLGDEVLLSAINVTGGQGNGYSFSFDYAGTTFASGIEDQAQFVPPLTGDFCVTVSEACSTPPATACVEVEVEQPYDLTLAADTTRGCVPQALGFSHSIPDVFVESQLWDFGDGGEGSLYEQVHVYDEPGVYDVALTVVTTTGCVNSTIANNYIQIFSPPSVGFTAGPQPTTAPDTRIDFDSDVSPTVTDWSWVFLPNVPEAVSSEPNPTYTFPMGNGGIYPVTLAVTDTNGCESQVTRNVEIFDFFNVYIPSAFTPNNDGFNDLWTVYGSDIDPDRFELSIFNRWGERVFHTTDIDRGWLGQSDDEVVDPAQMYFSSDGMYVYRVVFYSESTNEKREVRGYISLTR